MTGAIAALRRSIKSLSGAVLTKSNNLSDLDDAGASRDNLGLGSAAVADIVGTVSESGGVPAGDIMEGGTAGAGYYVRYAGGYQETWQTVSISSLSITTANALGGFRSAQQSAVLPKPFVSTTSMIAIPNVENNGDGVWAVGAVTSTSSVSFALRSQASGTFSGTVRILTKGFWF